MHGIKSHVFNDNFCLMLYILRPELHSGRQYEENHSLILQSHALNQGNLRCKPPEHYGVETLAIHICHHYAWERATWMCST